jgi:L-alanine-DL-glutamate epimerase-like enolase superfamily enzyme
MKITDIKTHIVSAAMPTPWRIGHYVLDRAYAILVEVFTDEGITGIGESIGRLGPKVSQSIIDDILAPCLIGANPMEIEGLWTRMFHLMRYRGHTRGFYLEAISGVDIALWDINGKALGLPVHQLMMGCNRREVPVYASSIFFDTPDKMAEVAVKLVERGFKAIKVKVGQGVEIDTACMEKIRQTVGPDVKLMVDANSAFHAPDASRLGKRLDALDVIWFEEPVPPDDLEGYKTLSSKLDMAIAAGEGEFTIYGVRRLLEHGVSVFQPDVARSGGITEARKMATLCQAFQAQFAPHTGASSAVCMAAAMHLSAAVPNFMIYEHMVGENPLAEALLTEPLPTPKDGTITIPNKPGLGIEIDRNALEKFRKF